MVAATKLLVLRRRAEFLAVAQSGKKWIASSLILQILKTPILSSDQTAIRYGLTASSKIGNAVVRNRARRRLRALAQSILLPHAAIGHDYVLIARGGIEKRDHEELVRDLTSALKKLSLWRE